MMQDRRLEQAFDALRGTGLEPPSLPHELEAELQDLKPVRRVSPYRRFAAVTGLSLAFGLGLLVWLKLREDMAGLPLLWIILYGLAWLIGFVTIAWLALVPRTGRVMPSWRPAGLAAAIATAGFITAGFLFAAEAPGLSIVGAQTLHGLAGFAGECLTWGTITALVPVALGALALRGALPVGSAWAGAGMGAAGGSLGGLLLHLHCPVADALHLGVVHGGVVAIGALIGAIIIPRAT